MNTFEEIKKLVKAKTGKDITIESNLKDIGIDSLDLLDLVVEAEGIFGIEISDEELLKLNTIQDVVNAIDAKR